MTRPRVKDFAVEAPKIARVAAAARAPRQLSLDELRTDVRHGWAAFVVSDYGYRRPCVCGWPGVERTSKRATDLELRRHVGMTPQGSVLLRTLRRVGRGANGS